MRFIPFLFCVMAGLLLTGCRHMDDFGTKSTPTTSPSPPQVSLPPQPAAPSAVTTKKPVDREKAMAYEFSKNFVEKSIKAQEKATFPPIEEVTITKLSAHKYRVEGYVDSPNALGGSVHTTYVCHLHPVGVNTWLCDDLLTQQKN